MNYKFDMERCRAYIEEHIQDEIFPRDLAKMLGYSFYHFCYVFRICNDMPVGEYIRKRRLEQGKNALGNNVRITDIALNYGFDTPSGFSKAFRRQFNITPRDYRKQIQEQKTKYVKGGAFMKVKTVTKDGFKAVGYSIALDGEGTIDIKNGGAYWLNSDFSSVTPEEYRKIAGENADQIGMWIHPKEKSGELSYFFGPIVDNYHYIPQGMIKVEIPAAEYAVFTTDPADLANDKEAFGDVINKTWKYIFEEWFDCEYHFDEEKFAFELYSDKNGGMDSHDAVVDIYIPLIKK